MSNLEVFANNTLYIEGTPYKCAVGKAGIGVKHGEGDNITPIGTFKLGPLYYRADRLAKPATHLVTHELSPQDAWCDDPTHPDTYNRFVRLPHPGTYEQLWRDDKVYDIIVPIGFNSEAPTPGAGSCIFMHVARPDLTPTAGCVTLSQDDLLEVVQKLGKDSLLTIHADDG